MLINILIDLIIVAIIAGGAVFGITKGFIASVAKPVKWVASIVLAFSLCTPFADAVVFPLIDAPITNQISEYLIEKCSHITASNVGEELPTLLKIAAGFAGIDVSSIQVDGTADFISQLVDKLAYPTIHLIAVIISFFAVYFLSKLVLGILLSIINHVFDVGVFGIMNRVLGFLFSTSIAFITAWLLTTAFGYVISLPAFADSSWVSSFDGGFIYKFFKGLSPIDLLLSF